MLPAPTANLTSRNPVHNPHAPASRPALAVLSPVDWLLVLLLTAVLVTLCVVRSHGRLLWADELISHQIFSDPSFLHMLRAWYRGADSGGLTYYLLCPVWLRVFGLSELSLRLFSTTGMAVALLLLWAALRRYVSTVLTSVALGIVFLTPPSMLWQELNGRFYGLYFAFAAFASLMLLLVIERDRPSRGTLACLLLAHAGLAASHIFGVLFSISLIVGSWAADRVRHRTRWIVYLLPVLGWSLALVSLPSLRASASVVKGVFWTTRPGLGAFFYSFAGDGRITAALLATLVCAVVVRLAITRPLPRPASLPLAPTTLVASLLLAALLFFLKSQVGISIFADRYLLPLLIATAFLIAGGLAVLLPAHRETYLRPVTTFLASAAALIPCCFFASTRDTNFLLYPTPAYLQQIARDVEPGVPTIAALPAFTLLHTYDRHHTYLFLTDWPWDNAPGHLADYSGERLMDNWKSAGYLAPDILPCTAIFARYPRVEILVGQHLEPWFDDRLLHNPRFRVQHIDAVRQWDYVDIWSVERLHPGPAPC